VAITKLNEFAKFNNLQVTGIVHDAMTIDKPGQFDFVIGTMILHHLEPFEKFCDVLRAAMKPGGKIF
jgi:2-polyprenyl-3-methyl-5-hydroxy-6-metoxy-1,4-benzoquinol methylase